mgnify:CR=1 FL=1
MKKNVLVLPCNVPESINYVVRLRSDDSRFIGASSSIPPQSSYLGIYDRLINLCSVTEDQFESDFLSVLNDQAINIVVCPHNVIYQHLVDIVDKHKLAVTILGNREDQRVAERCHFYRRVYDDYIAHDNIVYQSGKALNDLQFSALVQAFDGVEGIIKVHGHFDRWVEGRKQDTQDVLWVRNRMESVVLSVWRHLHPPIPCDPLSDQTRPTDRG